MVSDMKTTLPLFNIFTRKWLFPEDGYIFICSEKEQKLYNRLAGITQLERANRDLTIENEYLKQKVLELTSEVIRLSHQEPEYIYSITGDSNETE
jgi:hypothetical protein